MGFPAWINPFTVHIFFFSFFAVKVFFKINFFFLECSQFLWYGKVNQLYIYPLFLGFPSHLGCHRATEQGSLSSTVGSHQLSILCTVSTVYISQSQSPNSSHSPSLLGIHTFVLHVCVSFSALQIRSSIPFFLDSVYMLHIQYFSLSDLLFSCHVMSDSQRPHGLLHARLPCPSLSPRVCSDSHPLSQ